MLRASSLPALAKCAAFESAGSIDAEAGTDRHKALELHFKGDDSLLDLLDDEDQDGVRWAADYIRVHADTPAHPIVWETKTPLILDDFTEVPGTRDAACAFDIFDLKWRTRDYTEQMAHYAATTFQEHPDYDGIVRVHMLFGCFKRAEVLNFNRDTALRIVEKTVAKTRQNPEPNPCDYCGWCANRVTCPALNERAQEVQINREDWKLEQYHASQVTEPGEMSKAMQLAKHLKKWCEAVEHFAKEMAIRQGVTIPGYELKSKRGKSSCHNVHGAFQVAGLETEEFLQCCEIRLNTSKTNPAMRGLIDVLKARRGITKNAAKRELQEKLEPYLRTPKQTFYLKAINEPDETETEE